MVVQTDQEPAEVDPTTLAPLWNEAEFTEEINAMVAEEAPRLFAVVQEYGERVDVRVAAWGMAFENRVKAFAMDRSLHLSLRSPERVVRAFNHDPHITAHLVWADPDPSGR